MNGCPHLGHALTVLNSDFQARYYKMKGYNVMFPFGFHGTGMPIVACAKKLENELKDEILIQQPNSQFNILISMGISPDEIPNFVDPKYWITYFSHVAKEDFESLHIYADFTRSFFTTDLNPQFDAFVKWQFTNLIKDGYLHKGKKEMIYSVKDKQPCAIYERTVGESAEPLEVCTNIIDNMLVVVHASNKSTDSVDSSTEPIKIFANENDIFVSFFLNDKKFICNEDTYNNILHQYDNVIFEKKIEDVTSLGVIKGKTTSPSGFYTTLNKKLDEEFKYWIPSSTVISRSGDKCIVAKSDQWFINYDKDDVKEKIISYVTNDLKTSEPAITNKLLKSVNWLGEWPCSRNYGLGSYIPGTTDLIDSLSDSTIYMAYYTISHLINKLNHELIKSDNMNDIFDHIFLNKNIDHIVINEDDKNVIDLMKKEFNYWYPVDIRVSGKDLLGNHLAMALFSHYMIWKDTSKLPKTYFINGHLLLNCEKMSKHTGNFMTIRDAVNKYGTNVTRFMLASNEGYDDGNFNSELFETVLKRLTKEHNRIIEWNDPLKKSLYREDTIMNLWDHIFNNIITFNLKQANDAYESAKYLSITKAFYCLSAAADDYIKNLNKTGLKMNTEITMKFCASMLTILYPVCPSFAVKINERINNKFKFEFFENSYSAIHEYYNVILSNILDTCHSEVAKMIKKNKKIKSIEASDTEFEFDIIVYSRYTDEEIMLTNEYKTYNNIENIINNLTSEEKPKKMPKYKTFIHRIINLINVYGKDYLDWKSDEFEIIQSYLPLLLPYKCNISLHDQGDESTKFKFGPGQPKVVLVKK